MTAGLLLRRAAAEAVGTFFLVFIGTGAIVADALTGGQMGHVGVALAFAFVVTAMVYALGHLSGAHINPAVTLGFAAIGRFPRRDAAIYVVAQCAGAVLASLAVATVLGRAARLGATVPAVPAGAAFGLEWLMTFALMFVIMAVATDERARGGFGGLAIGLTVGFDALVGGGFTGASMNPARSLGPALVGGVWTAHWIYWLAPVTAAVVAGLTYEALRTAHWTAAQREPLGVVGPVPAEPAP